MSMSARAEASSQRSYYEAHGYVLVERLVPESRLDAVLQSYATQIKPAREKFFRQNTSRYERNEHSAWGHVRQSFLDIHDYRRKPELREAALRLYFCDEMLTALRTITGANDVRLMQSMLFDLNTATPPHQDCWYLDSVPSGRLLAAWIALEDIDERAGRFYVLPDSCDTELHAAGMPHTQWIGKLREHVDTRRAQLYAPAMRRGDVLFWNSRAIHGSFPTQDERYSRRSLTAHYLPEGETFGNIWKSKPWIQYQDWNGHKYFANQPEYSWHADLISRTKNFLYDRPRLMKLVRRLQARALSELWRTPQR
jgi:phytanoyl-CoA hydroxylase